MRILALFAFLITSCTSTAVATIAPYTPDPIKTVSPAEYTIEVPTFTATVSPTPKFAETVTADNFVITVYIPNILEMPVVQQPYSAFVSEEEHEFTQFSLAKDSVGLLAHDYLAGKYLSGIFIGEEIYITYNSGVVHKYVVIERIEFQATIPLSPYSDFIDVKTQEYYTTEELFNFIYNRPSFLILQTSIEPRAWGRLFIIAERTYG